MKIYLEGSVGFSFWGEPAFTAADVREMVGANSGPLTVYINSGGGIATEGIAIYNLLKAHPATVDVVINGIAASAASMIAMAGESITMLPGSLLMIHDPATEFSGGRGTADDHQRKADELDRMSRQWAGIYAERAGITLEDAREIMRVETYFTPEEALAAGFATAIGEEVSQAAAAFDYAVYAHAPKRLLGDVRANRPSKRSVMAMICGLDAPKHQELTMTEDEERAAAAAAAEAAAAEAAAVEAAAAEAVAAAALEEEGDDEEDDQTTAIMDLVEMHGDGIDVARDFIARRLPLASVITHYKQKGKPLTRITAAAPRSRITRDEGETRRQYMPLALAAQITRADQVEAPAREFMSMSLAQMMATCANYTGPLRSAGDINRMIQASTHTTSDFPLILEGALNAVLMDRYRNENPSYRAVSRRRDFRDFRAMPMVRSGDFPLPKVLGEGGEIQYGTIGEGKETAQLLTYASGIRITRQTIINDNMGAIDEALRDYGSVIAQLEESTFYAGLLSAVLSDGKAIFHTDHKNLAAAGAAITVASLGAARKAIREQKGLSGNNLNLRPSILLVGPAKETEAEMIVASVTPSQASEVNPFSQKLQVVVTPEITGNAWYVLADPNTAGGEIWTHGFLQGNAAPTVRSRDVFGRDGMEMEVIHDFGLGASGYQGGYKNPGA